MPVVAIAALAAMAQMYQSQQAAGASRAKLAELKAAFDALKPPNYNVSVMDPPAFIHASVPEASFNFDKMTPEQYKLVGKYAPTVAPLIAEKNPQLVKGTADSAAGRDAQLTALRKLKEAGTLGVDPELAQAEADASKKAQIAAQSRQASVLQDAARRGNAGAGTTLMSEMQGGSDAMERAANESQAAAVAGYRNKLDALRGAASLGGQVRDQDMSEQARNASIINDFNQRTSTNAQNYANRSADINNDAQRTNLAAEQHVADANTSQTNQAAYADRDRSDRLQQYLASVRQQSVDRQNSLIGAEADWRRGERNNQNDLAGRQYTDLFNKTAAANNVGLIQNQQNNQFAQDKNNAVAGVGNAAASGYMYSSSQDAADRRYQDQQDREDRRAKYAETGAWDDQE